MSDTYQESAQDRNRHAVDAHRSDDVTTRPD